VELALGDPLAHQMLAGILLLGGDANAAIAPVYEAMRLDPIESREPFLSMAGVAYLALERYDEAAAMFEALIEDLGIRMPNMEAFRAATYAALGREDEAREIIAWLNDVRSPISYRRWLSCWVADEGRSAAAIAAPMRLGLKEET